MQSQSSAAGASGAAIVDVASSQISDGTAGLAYLIVTLSSLLFGLPLSSPPYSDMGIPPPPSNCTGPGTTLNQTISATIQVIQTTIIFVNNTGVVFEDVQGPLGDCGAPTSTSVQPLIIQWQAILNALIVLIGGTPSNSTAAGNSTNGTASNTTAVIVNPNAPNLALSLNAAFLLQFTLALTGLKGLIIQQNAAGPVIAVKACGNNPEIRYCGPPTPESKCRASRSRSLKRKKRLEKKRASVRRKRGNRKKRSVQRRVKSRARQFQKGMRSGCRRQRNNIKYIYVPPVVEPLMQYNSLMVILEYYLELQINITLTATESASNSSGNATDDYILSAQNNVTEMFANFAATVLNNTMQYPNCTSFANLTLQVISSINDQILTCADTGDTVTSTVYSMTTSVIVTLVAQFNSFASECDKCVRGYASNWLWMYIRRLQYRFGLSAGIPQFQRCQSAVSHFMVMIFSSILILFFLFRLKLSLSHSSYQLVCLQM